MCQQKVEERFHRNPKLPVGDDVARRVFLLDEGKIQVSYHAEYYATIPSRRTFIKPLPATESRRAEDFTGGHVRTFQVETANSSGTLNPPKGHNVLHPCVSQVDPSEKPLSRIALYSILQDLVKDEVTAAQRAEESRSEVTVAIFPEESLSVHAAL